MKFRSFFSILISFVVVCGLGCAKKAEPNVLDPFNPAAPQVEDQLQELDEEYEAATGESPFLPLNEGTCYQESCPVFVLIDKETQTLSLYVEGEVIDQWSVSTGASGYGTPDFDRNPNGRIYDAYTSKRYPGGDYQGLGNMPYAVFIQGGYAIHGTSQGNWKNLGSKVSHGCIRLHPDHARILNILVRKHGVANVWITVQ